MISKKIQDLFECSTQEKLETIVELSAAGSNRKYFRLKGERSTFIGAWGDSLDENKAFCKIAEHFSAKGLNVPKVLAYAEDFSCYLQEDLGDQSLFDCIEQTRTSSNDFPQKTKSYLQKTIQHLPKMQFDGAKGFDFSVCYPVSEFDKRSIFWDLNYFKYNFLKTQSIDFREDLLEKDFETLSKILLLHQTDTFLYRDFQSRNVMIKDDDPFFIDFQGGRKGPIYYDVASFLWQAKANFSDELRQELIDIYLQEVQKYLKVSRSDFEQTLKFFVFFRMLQVLGAYGFRGYFERKKHFLQSIPFAMENLKKLLIELPSDFCPYLVGILGELTNRFVNTSVKCEKESCSNRLTVRVMSFSYKNGLPIDESGNGGGYVFDCRGIHNPGRYEPYKKLTGKDRAVIEFLEKDGEILDFLTSVYKLADSHIENYLSRGFENLMFCFGCTGGQHRSVYSAEHLAKHIVEKYEVQVVLEHREQKEKIVL